MKVLLTWNERSGRGVAKAVAANVRDWLRSPAGGGHEVAELATSKDVPREHVEELARASDVVVIAGGDGSVHHMAPIAARAGVPVYHLPCGNENLLAREFGMRRDPQQLSSAIAAHRTARIDLGRIGDHSHFILMASVGPDANVVHELARTRSRASGHLAYLKPTMREVFRPTFSRLRVTVDGKQLVDGERGMLVVANCGRYALGIDPLRRASLTDGKLDVLFMPCDSVVGALRWMVHRKFDRALDKSAARHALGKEMQVETLDSGTPYQVDGEAPLHGPDQGLITKTLFIAVAPAALSVLVPSDSQWRG